MAGTTNSFGDEPLAGMGPRPIYNAVYCSRASEGIGDAAVDRIIQSARRLNPERGITGLLVFGSGVFFQWLEGPRDNLLQLLSRLHMDPRHRDMVMLEESEEIRERLFPDWSMELVSANDIRAVLQDAHDNARDASHAATLAQLLVELDSGHLTSLGIE
jgi:hypothetical protein